MTRDLAADGLVADPARGAVRGRRGALEVLEFPSLHDRGVEIVVTTRSGGVSQAPYDTLNLGDHVGDDPACVEENRRRVAAAVRVDLGALMIARQVHGTDVAIVEPAGIIGDADVLATTDPSVALCVLVADCAPICSWTRAPRCSSSPTRDGAGRPRASPRSQCRPRPTSARTASSSSP